MHADLIFSEVNEHISGWCDSGHQAPATFRREGPGSPELPIRFFSVSGLNMHGIYCEPCLIVANHLARLKKQGVL